jgi:hypothetical protein
MNLASMAGDGSYSDSPYGGSRIDGYNLDNHGRFAGKTGKGRFLKDAVILLGQVADILAEKGVNKSEIGSNPSGPACSGKVVAEFWRDDAPLRRIWVEIGTTSGTRVNEREDKVFLLVRAQPYWLQGDQPARAPSGCNRFLPPEIDSRSLADRILKMYEEEFGTDEFAFTEQIHRIYEEAFGEEEKGLSERNLMRLLPMEESRGVEPAREAYKQQNGFMQMDLNLKEPVFIPKEQMSLL